MIYALKDGNYWLGNDEGVITYEDFELAKVAESVVSTQLGYRIYVEEYDPSPKTLKDTVTAKMTGEEAIKHIEEGGL